jgi:N-acetyl-1-D-myo-inositol-2-amino-2-deoxy-alpha-D-glucopyranoside deacetylase
VVNAPHGLLLVHAHPDDESLVTGGVIARYAALGVRVTVVTCTLGEEGEVIGDELRGLDVQHADQLGGYRVHELREACRALGVADHRYLGGIGRWRDSGMVGTGANEHPRALVNGPLDEQAAALAAIVAEVRPDVVVSYDSHGGYGHPDHIRAHEVTKAATASAPGLHGVYWVVSGRSVWAGGVAALAAMAGLPYQVPAPGALPTVPDDVVTTTVDIGTALPAKVEAIRAHATQVVVWEGARDQRAYALSDGVARPLCTVEQFALGGGTADPDDVRTDLFGGLPR